MSAIDIVLEGFNIDPLKNFEEIDPYNYFRESETLEEMKAMYTEASTGATKKNVLQKLLEFLKKVWNFIVKAVARVCNFFRNLVGKNRKTADQIAATSLGLSDSDIASSSGSTSSKSSSSGKSSSIFSSSTGSKVNIPVRKNPQSSVEVPDEIEMAFKPFCAKIDAEKKSIVLDYFQLNDRRYSGKENRPAPGGAQGDIVGQPAVKRSYDDQDWDNVILMILNPPLANAYMECIKVLSKDVFTSDELVNAWSQYCRVWKSAWNNLLSNDNFKKITFTMDQIQQFQITLNEINKTLEKVDMPKVEALIVNNASGKDGNSIIDSINNITGEASRFQMGINTITSVIRESFMIDQRFYEKATTTAQLDVFVKNCVDAGIPAKYISYNAYLISAPSIKGDGSQGDKDNPIWGQSRVCFFPTGKDFCHKIALSQWGIRANSSEIAVADKFKSLGGEDMLAMVLKSEANKCVIDLEKVDTSDVSPSAGRTLLDRLKDFCSTNKIPLDLSKDISPASGHNLGMKNGKACIIDYGMSDRTSIGAATT